MAIGPSPRAGIPTPWSGTLGWTLLALSLAGGGLVVAAYRRAGAIDARVLWLPVLVGIFAGHDLSALVAGWPPHCADAPTPCSALPFRPGLLGLSWAAVYAASVAAAPLLSRRLAEMRQATSRATHAAGVAAVVAAAALVPLASLRLADAVGEQRRAAYVHEFCARYPHAWTADARFCRDRRPTAAALGRAPGR